MDFARFLKRQELIGRCSAWQTRGVWYARAVKCRPWSAGPAGPFGKMGDMVPPREVIPKHKPMLDNQKPWWMSEIYNYLHKFGII